MSDEDFQKLARIVHEVCWESKRLTSTVSEVASDLSIVLDTMMQMLSRDNPMLLREFQEKLLRKNRLESNRVGNGGGE